ncbi:MAG: transposase family protein [Gammaproteobacteria bacterium]|nr:transposase family protein [Gammaproteobacteria bacterium]
MTEGLIVLWEASDRMCGKRLKAVLPTLLPALEQHGQLSLDPAVRERLLTVRAATIDRRLATARAVTAGQRRRRRSGLTSLRSKVPVRTFGDWKDPAPGFVEADLVAHCGGTLSGSFVWTLVLTDIASGWTECVPLLVREARLVVDALDQLRSALPFPLRGIDTDNGSEFLNEVLVGFCREQDIELTRSRPFRKNDQAWVEQKNGAVVRRLVGYGRLEGVAGAEALARLYSAARLFVNVFQPSFKLAEKSRQGARVRKRYHAPETPAARLLASDAVAAATKDRLRAALGTLDPLALLDEIRAVQHHLAALAAGRRSIRCRNAMLTSTGSCGASRSHGVPARSGRHIGLARDHLDTGAPGRIRSRRPGPESSSGSRPSPIGRRRSSSTAFAGNTPGRSPRASSAPCSAVSQGLAAHGRPSSPLRRPDCITPEPFRVADRG